VPPAAFVRHAAAVQRAPLIAAACAAASVVATTYLLRRGVPAAAPVVSGGATTAGPAAAVVQAGGSPPPPVSRKGPALRPAASREPGKFEVYTVSTSKGTTPAQDQSTSRTPAEPETSRRSLFHKAAGDGPASPMAAAVREWKESIDTMAGYIETLDAENGARCLLTACLNFRVRTNSACHSIAAPHVWTGCG
jgi:hypothetical protein